MLSFSFLTINFENVIIPANDAIRNDKISQLLEKRQDADMRELNRAMNEFRMMHQQPDSRREFDLYDPDYLKKDKPARVSDDDPRCGISSLQKFEGNHRSLIYFDYLYLLKEILENLIVQESKCMSFTTQLMKYHDMCITSFLWNFETEWLNLDLVNQNFLPNANEQ